MIRYLFKSIFEYMCNWVLSPVNKIDIVIDDFMLNPEFHWLRQIATTLCKFHRRFWIFLDAIAKAKKLICKFIAQNLKRDSLTRRLFSFGNGILFTPI